jgi:hypothetical protein
MSKINKNKQTKEKTHHTPKTPDVRTKFKSNNMKPRIKKVKTKATKGVDLNISIDSLKNLIPKPHEDLGPMERMAARERELENRNKK